MKKRISFRKSIGGDHQTSVSDEPPYRTAEPVDPDDFKTNLFELISLLYRRKSVIAILTISAMIVTAVIMILTPNRFTSTCSILPSGQIDRMVQIKGLASLGVGATSDENSSMLYPQILNSRHLRDAVLSAEFTFEDKGKQITATLSDYFESTNPDELRSQLAEIMSVGMDQMTGIITVSIETHWPGLSQAILDRALTELESYNLYKRQSHGRENVRYLVRELSRTKEELADAENELEDFRMANRDWDRSGDPIILTRHGRLHREVEAKSATYFYLEKQLEVARLDAQKDTPIVRVLDSPSLPTIKSSPHRAVSVLLIGIVTLFLTSVAIIMMDAFHRWSGRSITEIVKGHRDGSPGVEPAVDNAKENVLI